VCLIEGSSGHGSRKIESVEQPTKWEFLAGPMMAKWPQ